MNRKRNQIRLTESELHSIIKDSVKAILRESMEDSDNSIEQIIDFITNEANDFKSYVESNVNEYDCYEDDYGRSVDYGEKMFDDYISEEIEVDGLGSVEVCFAITAEIKFEHYQGGDGYYEPRYSENEITSSDCWITDLSVTPYDDDLEPFDQETLSYIEDTVNNNIS